MKKIVRWICTLIGLALGIPLATAVLNTPEIMNALPEMNHLIIYGLCMLILALIVYSFFPTCESALNRVSQLIEQSARDIRLPDLLFSVIGLIIGLCLAALITSAFSSLPVPWLTWVIAVPLYLILGYLGWRLPKARSEELMGVFNRGSRRVGGIHKSLSKRKAAEYAKLLDTSVLIDGRIIDIYGTQFMEGPLIVPVYVLNELQLISDSADDLKRSKGRRGLDVVAELQDAYGSEIAISEEDYDDLSQVDAKLIRGAKENGWKIITNDYNLNKLASVQGVTVLNINDLANAVKMVVMPGEEIRVTLIKAGKENGQAVAYLEDGTMIVVEHSRHYIGKTLDVVVTSVLQTSAGRMIFAKPKGAQAVSA